jgi:hypothetical protein
LFFSCLLSGDNYAAGGPRLVWEECPVAVNTTATECNLLDTEIAGGTVRGRANAACLPALVKVQQFMGHAEETPPTELSEAGADISSSPGIPSQ